MKAILVLMSLMIATTVSAQTTASQLTELFTPFKTKTMQKLWRLEDIGANSDYATKEGQFQIRVAKVDYNVLTDGGTIATRGLGVFLPAKAMIKQVWFRINTQFVDGGVGTVALQCEDAGNLFTATDITGSAIGTITAGAATGTAATMVSSIAATCEIQAVVAGAAQTAGNLTMWVEYVVHL